MKLHPRNFSGSRPCSPRKHLQFSLRGATLIESAITLVVLLTLFGAIIEISLAFYNISAAQRALDKAASAVMALPSLSCSELAQRCDETFGTVQSSCTEPTTCCTSTARLCQCYKAAGRKVAEKELEALAIGGTRLAAITLTWAGEPASSLHLQPLPEIDESGLFPFSLSIEAKLSYRCFFCNLLPGSISPVLRAFANAPNADCSETAQAHSSAMTDES